jgi:hypothetical protein
MNHLMRERDRCFTSVQRVIDFDVDAVVIIEEAEPTRIVFDVIDVVDVNAKLVINLSEQNIMNREREVVQTLLLRDFAKGYDVHLRNLQRVNEINETILWVLKLMVKHAELIEPEQRHSSAGVTFLHHNQFVTSRNSTYKLINVFN